MARYYTHDPDILKETADLALSKINADESVTEPLWNMCYEIVLAKHQIEMIDWKLQNITVGA